VAISLDAPFRQLYQRMAIGQSGQIGSDISRSMLFILVVLGALFMIIQGTALVWGAALARQITYAVHELFLGTEHVRHGDFSHRIKVTSQDQLGDLADSFNRMSGSIEHLLHVQREKQRLDDELRIAREIQKSLLPMQLPKIDGLSIADLCEPAREVGGDYYDFFQLGPRQLGVLIADVSGKGTSAALYMAELKGLMLALSQKERSPRRLFATVNHLLAEHLDNRSFITAMYAVIDLDAMTLTCARAGHTPLIVVSNGQPDVVTPNGMVLGLRLPGASERFETILEEHTRPLQAGDLMAFYTDGITEAMNQAGDLFGEAALAQVLVATPEPSAGAVRERVVREVQAFVGDAEPHDDMTMVIIKVDHVARSI
jgi:sigma-B regulation protein RsbU (phosphoserine phosphatase)